MPDTPVEPPSRGPYDPGLELRVSRLEEDMREMKAANLRTEALLADLRQSVARIEATMAATLPHLATKADVAELRAELAEKPSRAYLWGVLAALITAYAAGLAVLAILK